MKILYKTDMYSQQRQKEKPVWIYPVHMAMQATFDREEGHEVHWNADDGGEYDEVVTKPRSTGFLSLPIPDRVWTGAFDKRYQQYGNYKYHPATHTQVAHGCWHGKCTFCVESRNWYQVRPMRTVIKEIEQCYKLGFKEIFDDSGTFPDGKWLEKFCAMKIKIVPDVFMGCNMRIGADANFDLMKLAGFRMVLFGIESANQSTLDLIQKGIYAKDIIPTIKRASDAGLEPHIAVMFGQPGEGEEEERKTLELVHYLLRRGYAKTAQASVFEVSGRARMDRGNTRRIYQAAHHPDFWINRIKDIREWADVCYLLKGIRKGIIHD